MKRTKKRIISSLIASVAALWLLMLPVAAVRTPSEPIGDPVEPPAAAEETTAAPEESTAAAEETTAAVDEERTSFFEDIKNLVESLGDGLNEVQEKLDRVGDWISDPIGLLIKPAVKLLPDIWIEILDEKLLSPFINFSLQQGGYQYVSDVLNENISRAYTYFYPFGFAVLLLSWVFGMAKSGFTVMRDLNSTNSIVLAALRFIVALVVMSMSPWVLNVMTSLSMQMCRDVCQKLHFEALGVWQAAPDGRLGYAIFIFIVQFTLMLNVAYMALLQCLCPLFVGFVGNDGTRHITINYVREYAKCCLVPPVTALYAIIASNFISNSTILIGGLVLSISAIGIAGKKLDALLR